MDKIDMYKAVVEINFPLMPAQGNESFLRGALQGLLWEASDSILIRGQILNVRILPAAAGEGKTLEEIFGAECLVYLRQEQRNRIAELLKNWLAPTAVEVWAARLSPTTNTLLAYIRFQDSSGERTEQFYSQTLLPETATFILGEDEDWDPTKM